MTSGWKEIQLGRILNRADRFEKKDELHTYRFAGTYSFARGIFAGEIKEGSTFRLDRLQRIKKGDFIYCKIMAWEGAFGIAPESVDDCVMSGAFVTYELDQTKIDPRYLGYYFKQEPVWKSIGSQSTGTNVRRRSLHPDQFEQARILLPPLTEQRRIVARIEALAKRVEEAQRLREETDHEADELVNNALNHLLVAKEDWETRAIAEISIMSTGTTPPSHRFDYYGGDMQWYSPGDLGFEKELGKSSRTVSETAIRENKVRIFQPGTILLVAIGASLGKVGLVRTPCSSNQQITGILFNKDIFPDFGFWWMRRLYRELRDAAPQATLPIINQRRIGEFCISYPPLDEQRRIVAYLDGLQEKLNALREMQSATGKELSAMMPSILDKAFKGEL